MKFQVEKEPYEENLIIFRKKEFELNPNSITCFIGCNGSGKSTLFTEVKESLSTKEDRAEKVVDSQTKKFDQIFDILREDVNGEKPKKPTYSYINFHLNSDFSGDMTGISRLFRGMKSNGEGLMDKFGDALGCLGTWIRDPENKGRKLFVLFDDCDSGTSIDVMMDIKGIISMIQEDCEAHEIEYYIILNCNSYELCRDYDCLCVQDFKFRKFKTYESYKKFVLKSREWKVARDEHFNECVEKEKKKKEEKSSSVFRNRRFSN